MKVFGLFFLYLSALFSQTIETFYGPIDVEDPVILDLIQSDSFQRLKHLHQYGVAYYITHPEEYTRYDHSLGVFYILRRTGRSLEEQISGLLHDVSHTAFSHVGDTLFDHRSFSDSYQDTIHAWFLEKSGMSEILLKHGLTPEKIFHQTGQFPSVKCPLPDLSADRIDYNLQGAYYQGFLNKEEIEEILSDLTFNGSVWISSKASLMHKLGAFALHMSETCWGSVKNTLTSQWLAQALKIGLISGLTSDQEIHFGTDQILWDKLLASSDPLIQEKIYWILHADDFFTITTPEKATYVIKTKFRGIDPWIRVGDSIQRLSFIDPEYRRKYEACKERMRLGWQVYSPHFSWTE